MTVPAWLRQLCVVVGAAALVLGAAWTRYSFYQYDPSIAAIVVLVVGSALFLRAYVAGTPLTAPLPKDADVYDRILAWIVQHGAVPALVAITAITGVMFSAVFLGETVGDDLTFHMAESARLADCLREGDWDFWNPSANGGYASAYYYQVVPQLASAIPAALFGHHLFWFQLSLWLPQIGIPLAAYRGLRIMGAAPWQALCGAFAVTFISGASRWGSGADGTFQVGLYTQTWALAAFPLGLGHGVRYLTEGKGLAPAVAWGAFVFLCHPFASIALCLGLAFGVLAHYLQFPVRGRVLQLVLLGVLGVAIAVNLAALLLDPAIPGPAKPPAADVDVPWRPKYIYVAPLILFTGLFVRVLARGKALTKLLLLGIALAFLANALGFATIEVVPKKPEGATVEMLPEWTLAGASLYIGPLLLLAAIAGRLALSLGRPAEPDDARPGLCTIRTFVRLCIIGACLLVATAPGWLTVIVDRDGFGGFPHRVSDEVGPGYQELMRWYTKGALLDNHRVVILTWALPLVVLLARMRFARWLWAPAIVYATLLALGPHAPKTADDLLPAVRFLGAMQVVLAMAIGAGLYAIGHAAWYPREDGALARLLGAIFRRRTLGDLVYAVRTAVVAAAVALVLIVGLGARAVSNRVAVLEGYDYRGEMMDMIAAIERQPPGRKQVGPGCENHWWNLLSYVYARRPSLLQMGGGGLQASPNYDFLWSVRDFPKLAWVYDTPLFVYARSNTASAPAGEVVHQTTRYELRRLKAPGLVSPIEITGSLPEGESRAGSRVRTAAIEWLRGKAPLENRHLAYHGHGEPTGAPEGRVRRAFRVDPSPGETADIYADVEVTRPTTFVVRESWHPRWHAYVDGVEVPIRRVTPDFPAIDVPAGTHTIALRFERPWWATAVWLLWPGIVLVACAATRRRG